MIVNNHFRRKAIAKYSSSVKTAFLPLAKIHSAAVLINVDSPSFKECWDNVIQYFNEKSIKCDCYFLDFRKSEKNELLPTSIQNTFLRKDLNWYGLPDKARFEEIVSHPVDLLISLVADGIFANDLLCASIPASFKIGGRESRFHLFNMVFTGKRDVDNFRNVTAMLEKITD